MLGFCIFIYLLPSIIALGEVIVQCYISSAWKKVVSPNLLCMQIRSLFDEMLLFTTSSSRYLCRQRSKSIRLFSSSNTSSSSQNDDFRPKRIILESPFSIVLSC